MGSDGAEELKGRLAKRLGAKEITDLRRLSGGASRETWWFEADGRALVLQRKRATALERPGVTPVAEAALLLAAGRAGMAVPTVVACSDGDDQLGAPYLLMEAVEG